MKELFYVFTALLFILPIYYIGLYFLFLHLKNVFNTMEQRKGYKPIPKEEIENKIDVVKEELKEFNNKIEEVPNIVEKELEKKISEEAIKEEKEKSSLFARTQEFLARHQYKQFRSSISIKNLEEKIKIVLNRVLDTYMTEAYLNNPRFAKSDGTYLLPEISESARKADLEKVYRIFRNVASDEFVDDISPIYKIDTVRGEEFFISTYLAPMYNAAIEGMKKMYKESIDHNNQIEKRERAKMEEAFSPAVIAQKERMNQIMQELDSIEAREKYFENKIKNLNLLREGKIDVVESNKIDIGKEN